MAVRPAYQRYLRGFGPAMGGHGALIASSGSLVPRTDSAALRTLPTRPVRRVMRARVRTIRDLDQLERQIDTPALAGVAPLTPCGFRSSGWLASAGVPAAPVALRVPPCFFGILGRAELVPAPRLRGR